MSDPSTSLTITFAGFPSQAARDSAVAALARNAGWTATVPDPDNEGQVMPNPITVTEAAAAHARAILGTRVREQLAAETNAGLQAQLDNTLNPVTVTVG